MSVKITCYHCKAIFEKWDFYARHILEKHPKDQERTVWANHALGTGDTSSNPIVIDKPAARKSKLIIESR